ncbi:MAG: alpha/beta hydrolase, partial [Deltaproteobacteria bacterium]|nr:alpha/beta hydrolase [Deltaproteobacteria bacterium]
HGFAANQGTWFDLTPFFAKDQYTLHLLDLPPHGVASRRADADYSIPAQATRVRTFLELQTLPHVDLIGHSLGGSIALAALIQERETCSNTIERVILIGTPAYPMPIPRFIQLLSLPLFGPLCLALAQPETIARKGLEAVFVNHRLITPERIARYATTFSRSGTARALTRCARQLIPKNHLQFTNLFQQLTTPTQLIWGEHDRIVWPDQGRQLEQEMPNATLSTIANCGHNPHEEYPKMTFDIIEHFLNNNPVDR